MSVSPKIGVVLLGAVMLTGVVASRYQPSRKAGVHSTVRNATAPDTTPKQTSAVQRASTAPLQPSPVPAPVPEVPASPTPSRAQAEHLARLAAQDKALTVGLKGQLQRMTLPADPLVQGRKINVWVYLPPDYATSGANYPVAYILHGAPGGIRDCFVNAKVHRVAETLITGGKVKPMILVGWDGDGPGGPYDETYYLNRADGYRTEDFAVQTLVPWIDDHYRTQAQPEARALVGFSAGGYGAANLGLKHPDIWKVICSHAGFFDPSDDTDVMTKILGPYGAAWNENDPIERVRELPIGMRLHFYMDVGRDDSLLGEFKKLRAELQARQVDFEAHIFSGSHSWEYLNQHYNNSLMFCDQRWREMAAQQPQDPMPQG